MRIETATWTGGVPGYSDGVLPGAYAFGVPGKGIRTASGLIQLPGTNAAAGYVRLADDGVRILCQGQNDDRAWLWDGSAWAMIGVAFGTDAVIFGPDGAPVINDTKEKFQATGGLRAVIDGRIVGCTESYADAARGLYAYTDFGDVAIGQGGKDIGQGAVVRFADDGVLRRLTAGVIRNVRAHRVGDQFAITTLDYGAQRAMVTWCTGAELRTLPAAVTTPVVPTFRFTHPVIVALFKAAGSGLTDLFELGTYREGDLPRPLPQGRLLLAHDGPSDWVIPSGDLRSYDCVLWELYRVRGETLAQSLARWDRQSRNYLAQWPRDCGVIPMFYDQENPGTGEKWSEAEMLEALDGVTAIVNLSPRIKVIAPFAYDRVNGIVKYPVLQAALGNLNTEAQRVGRAVLTPPPPPPPPPKPRSPYRLHTKRKTAMTDINGKIVVLRGAGGRLVRPDAPNTGLWKDAEPRGWRGTIGDGADAADDRYHHRATRVDGGNYALTHATNSGLLGADATKFSTGLDKQFYYKPDGDTDRGGYETWRIYEGNENGALQAQIEYADESGKYFSASLAVEVVG